MADTHHLNIDPAADLDIDLHTEHVYLSTACWHDNHIHCQAMTGYQGVKRPAQCKFCEARCVCSCHRGRSAPALPVVET